MSFIYMQKQYVQQCPVLEFSLYAKHTHLQVEANTQNDWLEQSQGTTPCLRGELMSHCPVSVYSTGLLSFNDQSYPVLSNILIYQYGRNILDYEGPHDITVHLLLQSCYQLYTFPYSLCCMLLTLPLSSSVAGVMPVCTCPILSPAPFIFRQLSAMVVHEVEKLKEKKVVLGLVGIPVMLCAAVSILATQLSGRPGRIILEEN